MIIGIGTDLVVIERFQAMLDRRPGLAERLLTPAERELSIESQAARFSAKEALAKALGSPGGMRWLDCEVVKNADGASIDLALRGLVSRGLGEEVLSDGEGGTLLQGEQPIAQLGRHAPRLDR